MLLPLLLSLLSGNIKLNISLIGLRNLVFRSSLCNTISFSGNMIFDPPQPSGLPHRRMSSWQDTALSSPVRVTALVESASRHSSLASQPWQSARQAASLAKPENITVKIIAGQERNVFALGGTPGPTVLLRIFLNRIVSVHSWRSSPKLSIACTT